LKKNKNLQFIKTVHFLDHLAEFHHININLKELPDFLFSVVQTMGTLTPAFLREYNFE